MWSYRVQAIRFFVETKQKTKKGKPIKRPVVQRTLYITGKSELSFLPNSYKVFQVKRRGVTYYSVASVKKRSQNIWQNPSGRPETWYKADEEFTKEDNVSSEKFLAWLGKFFKDDAARILIEYLTAVPVPPDAEVEEAA